MQKKNRTMTEKESNQIVGENLNYVKAVANHYTGKGVEFEDLVSEGTLAMILAAKKFDASKGTKFVSYAAPFIRKALQRAIDQQAAIYRVPKDLRKSASQVPKSTMSVDAPLSAGNQFTLLDILENKDVEMADDNMAFQAMLKDLKANANQLMGREREVIERLYGLDNNKYETMAEIATDMGLKRERVRQIRDCAIRKMRRNSSNKVLRSFLKK